MTIEHILAEPGRLPDEVATFGPPNNQTLVNLSELPVILRTPSIEECERLLGNFRTIQHKWVLDCLLTPNKAGTHLAGLAGNIIPRDVKKGVLTHFSPRILALGELPEAAWACLTEEPRDGMGRSSLLSTADIPTQERFLRASLGGSMAALEKAIKTTQKHVYVGTELDIALKEATDGLGFILRVLALREQEKSFSTKRPLSGRNGIEDKKSPLPDLFALWLCRHGILLLPPSERMVSGKKDSHGPLLIQKLVRPGLLEQWKRVTSENPNSKAGLDRRVVIDRAFHILAASSNIGEHGTFPSDAFGALKNHLDGRAGTGAGRNPSHTLHLIHERLRPPGQAPLPRISKRPTADVMTTNGDFIASKFAWTTMDSESPEAAGLLPTLLSRPFDGRNVNHVSLCAHHLTLILETRDVSRVNNLVGHYQRYLAWLAGYCPAKATPLAGTLMMGKREDVNDGKSLNDSPCFRAWLFRNTTPDVANRTMAALSAAFETYETSIATHGIRPARANPFEMSVDAFRTSRNTRTHRTAIQRQLIHALAALNRRDDYALSRADSKHHHNVFAPKEKTCRSVWFPGVAVMMEILLTLPLRETLI